MAVIYADSNDGNVGSPLVGSFAAARSHTGDNASNRQLSAYTFIFYSSRGGGSWGVQRSFFEFDTSGISVTPSIAKLYLYAWNGVTSDVIAVKSTHGDPLAAGDFDSIDNASTPLAASDGSGAGTFAGTSVVPYDSSGGVTFTANQYNAILLNAAALSDMASLSLFKICIMDYDYDYLDIDNGTNTYTTNGYYSDYTGTSRDPYISYTAGTAAVTENATFFGTNF